MTIEAEAAKQAVLSVYPDALTKYSPSGHFYIQSRVIILSDVFADVENAWINAASRLHPRPEIVALIVAFIAARAEITCLKESLKDPITVHAAILRGDISITKNQLRHIAGQYHEYEVLEDSHKALIEVGKDVLDKFGWHLGHGNELKCEYCRQVAPAGSDKVPHRDVCPLNKLEAAIKTGEKINGK